MNITFENDTKRKSFIVSKVIIGNEPPIWYELKDKEDAIKGDKLMFSLGKIRVNSKVASITKLENSLYFSLGDSMVFKNTFIKLSRYRK